jgi:hypothetical protein
MAKRQVNQKLKWKSFRNYFKKNRNELSMGMRFIYENYSKDCWYWEVIELVRKVILTSVLIYSGQSGRLFLGMSAIFSGFYAVFFANSKPIPYMFEHWLHLGSLIATQANQCMAMLLKIPVEQATSLVNTEDDSFGVSVLLVFANVFLLLMIAGKNRGKLTFCIFSALDLFHALLVVLLTMLWYNFHNNQFFYSSGKTKIMF